MNSMIEFKGNTEHDRFALYLRPLDANGQPLFVPGATESQERWGGLHATLCGFAPKKGSPGASATHPSSLVNTLNMVYAAAKSSAKQGVGKWRLSRDAWLPLDGRALVLLPTDTGKSRTLRAISEAVSSAGLLNARAAEELHISIGTADPARVQATRNALLGAPRWEVVIAKCEAGTTPLQVTSFRESRELVW